MCTSTLAQQLKGEENLIHTKMYFNITFVASPERGLQLVFLTVDEVISIDRISMGESLQQCEKIHAPRTRNDTCVMQYVRSDDKNGHSYQPINDCVRILFAIPHSSTQNPHHIVTHHPSHQTRTSLRAFSVIMNGNQASRACFSIH